MEDIISQHEAVSEVAVIGVSDEKWGERPLALVVLKKDDATRVSPDEIKAFCMKFVEDGTLPKYGVPDEIRLVDSIAKTSVGKINKRLLRKDYAKK